MTIILLLLKKKLRSVVVGIMSLTKACFGRLTLKIKWKITKCGPDLPSGVAGQSFYSVVVKKVWSYLFTFFICTQFLSSFTKAVFSCFRNNPTFIQKALSPTVTSAICVPLSIPILKRSKKIGAAAATTFKRSTVHLKILKACTAYSMMMRKSSLAYETTL